MRLWKNLGKQAVVAAAAGADFIAPSAAMDGQVQAIRRSLDAAGFYQYRDYVLLDQIRVIVLRPVP